MSDVAADPTNWLLTLGTIAYSMSAPYSTLTASDYLDAAQALLPNGPGAGRAISNNFIFGKYMGAVANVAWLAHRMLAELFVTELDPGAANMPCCRIGKTRSGLTARGSKADRRINLKSVIADPGRVQQGLHCVAVAAAAGVEITTADVFGTTPFHWELHAPTNTPIDAQAALESAIALHNRATCVVTFTTTIGDPIMSILKTWLLSSSFVQSFATREVRHLRDRHRRRYRSRGSVAHQASFQRDAAEHRRSSSVHLSSARARLWHELLERRRQPRCAVQAAAATGQVVTAPQARAILGQADAAAPTTMVLLIADPEAGGPK